MAFQNHSLFRVAAGCCVVTETYHIPVDLDALTEEVASRLNGDYVLPRLMDVRGAAKYLGRSPEGVRAMIKRGKLPTVREGRRVMLDRVDLDRWIAERKG